MKSFRYDIISKNISELLLNMLYKTHELRSENHVFLATRIVMTKTLLCNKEYDKEIKGLYTEINYTGISLKFLFTVKFYS